MFCKGEIVVGVEEGLLLLPSILFNEVFLDCIDPFPQIYKGSSHYGRKPRMWYEFNHSNSMERPSDDAGAARMKPRGTGVFLPSRPVNSSQENSHKKSPCPMISSSSRHVFLPDRQRFKGTMTKALLCTDS